MNTQAFFRRGALAGAAMAMMVWATRVLAAEPVSGTVAGQVVNAETGRGIAGAMVNIPVFNRAATSDLEGGYRFTGVPAGTLEMTVSKPGFQPFSISAVTVSGGDAATVDVALTAVRDTVIKMEAFSVSAEVLQNS